MFAKMSYHDKFGCLVCSQPPLNIVLSCFTPFVIAFSKDEEKIYKINEFICHVLYFPFAVMVTLVFTVLNAFTMPIAYIVHTMRLLFSVIE
jgi:hypothetical protein